MCFALNAKGELRVHPSTHSIRTISKRETKEDPPQCNWYVLFCNKCVNIYIDYEKSLALIPR